MLALQLNWPTDDFFGRRFLVNFGGNGGGVVCIGHVRRPGHHYAGRVNWGDIHLDLGGGGRGGQTIHRSY